MSIPNNEKRIMLVNEFVTNAEDAFKAFIPRDKVDDIDITQYSDNGGAVEITGSVSATSPTGKLKTYGYTATVNIDADGECSFAKLHVIEP